MARERPEELEKVVNGGEHRGGRRRRCRRFTAPQFDSFGQDVEDGEAELRSTSVELEEAQNGGETAVMGG